MKTTQLRAIQKDAPDLQWMEVTPELAATWIRLNVNNRPVREAVVRRYAEEMAAGNWPDNSPEAIVFSAQGNLLDGQHRLLAILRTNKTIRMLVVRQVDSSMAHIIDRGINRTVRDSISIYQKKAIKGGTIQALLRFVGGMYVAQPVRDLPYTREELGALYEKYEETFSLLDSLLVAKGKRGITASPVKAALARAWLALPEQHGRIREFIDVLITGRYQDEAADSAALALRDHLLSADSAGGGAASFAQYAKAESALDKFIRRQPAKGVSMVNAEKFEINEDRFLK